MVIMKINYFVYAEVYADIYTHAKHCFTNVLATLANIVSFFLITCDSYKKQVDSSLYKNCLDAHKLN